MQSGRVFSIIEARFTQLWIFVSFVRWNGSWGRGDFAVSQVSRHRVVARATSTYGQCTFWDRLSPTEVARQSRLSKTPPPNRTVLSGKQSLPMNGVRARSSLCWFGFQHPRTANICWMVVRSTQEAASRMNRTSRVTEIWYTDSTFCERMSEQDTIVVFDIWSDAPIRE